MDINGKAILITGASSGTGETTEKFPLPLGQKCYCRPITEVMGGQPI